MKGGALTLLLVAVTLAGCSSTDADPINPPYRFCLEHGGDYEFDNWSGSYECDLPPGGAR